MNIETKIAEIEREISELTPKERALWNESTAKEKIYKESNCRWSEVYHVIAALKEKHKALIDIKKDCECVISRGVPVADEDIGRTVNIERDSFTGRPVVSNRILPNGRGE